MSSRGDVATLNAERYAKQLVSHLGRRLHFTTAGPVSTATVGSGTGEVVVGDGVLTLVGSGPDEQALATVEHVLGSHLLRFATREHLTVSWSRTTAQAPLA